MPAMISTCVPGTCVLPLEATAALQFAVSVGSQPPAIADTVQCQNYAGGDGSNGGR